MVVPWVELLERVIAEEAVCEAVGDCVALMDCDRDCACESDAVSVWVGVETLERVEVKLAVVVTVDVIEFVADSDGVPEPL